MLMRCPILFIIYASELLRWFTISFHTRTACYAYDTQIYLSFKHKSSTSQHREEKELADPGLTPYNNDDKTEFMIIGARQKLCKLQAMNIEVGSSSDTKPISRKLKI